MIESADGVNEFGEVLAHVRDLAVTDADNLLNPRFSLRTLLGIAVIHSNLYAYGSANPINRFDPTGGFAAVVRGLAAGFGAGAAIPGDLIVGGVVIGAVVGVGALNDYDPVDFNAFYIAQYSPVSAYTYEVQARNLSLGEVLPNVFPRRSCGHGYSSSSRPAGR